MRYPTTVRSDNEQQCVTATIIRKQVDKQARNIKFKLKLNQTQYQTHPPPRLEMDATVAEKLSELAMRGRITIGMVTAMVVQATTAQTDM